MKNGCSNVLPVVSHYFNEEMKKIMIFFSYSKHLKNWVNFIFMNCFEVVKGFIIWNLRITIIKLLHVEQCVIFMKYYVIGLFIYTIQKKPRFGLASCLNFKFWNKIWNRWHILTSSSFFIKISSCWSGKSTFVAKHMLRPVPNTKWFFKKEHFRDCQTCFSSCVSNKNLKQYKICKFNLAMCDKRSKILTAKTFNF